jgi:hypothetical protein
MHAFKQILLFLSHFNENISSFGTGRFNGKVLEWGLYFHNISNSATIHHYLLNDRVSEVFRLLIIENFKTVFSVTSYQLLQSSALKGFYHG